MEAWNPYLPGLFAALILIVPLWRIFSRAGLAAAWSLLIFLPFVGALAVLLVLAFSRWPADPFPREVER